MRCTSWDLGGDEYEKLRRHDADAPPLRVFQCHQTDADNDSLRVCASWAGCHNGDNPRSLRLAVLQGRVNSATYRAVVDYKVTSTAVQFRRRGSRPRPNPLRRPR
ncbi:DUF6283 family protein [Streptomyces sp. NRRL F-4428]|uniref:DUF6283 family protein n=1 Tax=Streptomyces sp. NRRL F-4428 TaxID=1609137 RepID=UPI000B326FC4